MSTNYCKNGFLVVTPSYRLVKTAEHPAQIKDIASVIKWVYDHIEEFGGDINKLFLSGHSAGCELILIYFFFFVFVFYIFYDIYFFYYYLYLIFNYCSLFFKIFRRNF